MSTTLNLALTDELRAVADGIIMGYQDVIDGRVIPWSGSARADHARFRTMKAEGKI